MRATTLVATTVAVAVTATIGGAVTAPAVQSRWYARLHKPPYQPPRQVFPVVWPVLYVDLAAVSAATIDELHRRGARGAARRYRLALAVNLVLNAGWSWLFFGRRRLRGAAVTAAALTLSSADLTRRAAVVDARRGALLAAYPSWCAFATALSTHLWVTNRGRVL
ncbi:tryptophan-rich sensory protein [Mycobacterium koreense]|uniref:TspO protein n=1 Tax=Mycolicibacillus koreensis TaxID=1069220 RepID=A0A7I7SHA4_9MYCO|nr:TspO/MBR family protein [Mycolicibacillus koreensis]MCV7248366.1 tryptophan-rich sensory protein [Mycolicibacillus koreensis]OSC34314.1 TspO protein [Mycolicibacillus koreensis]BBY55306.1 tryptophan-rich sensory protein [Mycolicibacillus koreensis]